MTRRQKGSIHSQQGGHLANVEYMLEQTGIDRAIGQIWIDDDPTPGHRFMGDPALAGGQTIYRLIAENGAKVEIFFTNSEGNFTCVLADQAGEALN